MENRYGNIYYIYACATDINYRGLNYNTTLAKRVLKEAYINGNITCLLIPAPQLENYWGKLHFRQSLDKPLIFHLEQSFDFGTGDVLRDFGMFRIINMEKYLNTYAKEYYESEFTVSVIDIIICENDGVYEVKKSTCVKISNAPSDPVTPDKVFQPYPLIDNNLYV